MAVVFSLQGNSGTRKEEFYVPSLLQPQQWRWQLRVAASPEAAGRRKPPARDKPWGLGGAPEPPIELN